MYNNDVQLIWEVLRKTINSLIILTEDLVKWVMFLGYFQEENSHKSITISSCLSCSWRTRFLIMISEGNTQSSL